MFILYEQFGDFPAMAMMTRVSGKPIFFMPKKYHDDPSLSLIKPDHLILKL